MACRLGSIDLELMGMLYEVLMLQYFDVDATTSELMFYLALAHSIFGVILKYTQKRCDTYETQGLCQPDYSGNYLYADDNGLIADDACCACGGGYNEPGILLQWRISFLDVLLFILGKGNGVPIFVNHHIIFYDLNNINNRYVIVSLVM